jgi:hypothetical protein
MAIWKIITFVFRSDPGRYNLFSSAGSSNIKIRTSPAHPGITIRALYANEVRILIYDDPAAKKESQCPVFCSTQVWDRGYIF